MCFSDDARPPLPPVGGASTDHGDIHLTAADGNRFMAHYARAAEPTGAGMVVLPDVRGLHNFYKELAQRFAEAGIDAIAIDYFGRSAGDGTRDESFEFRQYVEKTSAADVQADAAAAAEWLRSREGGSVRAVFSVGFCWGGSNSWNQSAAGYGLAGAVGFYGVPSRSRDLMPRYEAPLLMLIAGADFTPLEEFQKFDRELTAAGKAHTMVVYDGAPHSFFDRSFNEHKEACDDAWRQILAFVGEHTPAA